MIAACTASPSRRTTSLLSYASRSRWMLCSIPIGATVVRMLSHASRSTWAELLLRDAGSFGSSTPLREPLSATLNWKHFSKADVDVEVFQDVCTRRPDDHPLQTRLKELAARFPKAKDITEALQRDTDVL